MRVLSRLTLAMLLLACLASLAQAQTTNLYTGSINAQVGFGVPLPFAGLHTEPGGPTQPTNLRGVGIPGPKRPYLLVAHVGADECRPLRFAGCAARPFGTAWVMH